MIERQDEMLELLYWLEGEGFTDNATLDGIARFIAQERERAEQTLERLIERGDVTLDPSRGEYRLSETGRREAARRFAEEFTPYLAQGHGECSDPECDCRESGPDACKSAR